MSISSRDASLLNALMRLRLLCKSRTFVRVALNFYDAPYRHSARANGTSVWDQ